MSPHNELRSRLSPVGRAPMFAAPRSVAALVLREMSATYGRSPGGYLWAVLEPAAGIFLLVMIFSTGFRTPPLGTNFAIFYASGILPFFMFLYVTNRVAQAINFSKQLLTYPRVTYLDAILARFILAALTQILVSLIIFTVILSFFDTRTVLVLSRLVHAYSMALALALGIGLINAVLFARFPIWQQVWSVFTRPLILVSGVIFLHDRVPEPYRTWLEWNPLVSVTGEARRAFYYSYTGDYVSPGYVFGVALLTGVLGLLFLQRYYRDLMEL